MNYKVPFENDMTEIVKINPKTMHMANRWERVQHKIIDTDPIFPGSTTSIASFGHIKLLTGILMRYNVFGIERDFGMPRRTPLLVNFIFIGLICLTILSGALGGYFYWRSIHPPTPANVSRVPVHNQNNGLNKTNWRPIFDDEFNSGSLDAQKWNIEDAAPEGYQNCCLGYGVQYFTPQALSFQDGSLRIATQRQYMEGSMYTSGAITTENKFSFLYGRIDIRARLPKTQGFWPAFWLLPDHSTGIAPFEIDLMEIKGQEPSIVHMTNHWGRTQITHMYTGPDFSQGYHVFSIVWTSQAIRWYIDGVQRFETTQGISNQKMYLIISSSLGGRWTGNPDASTILPQSLNIDYVRVYQEAAKD